MDTDNTRPDTSAVFLLFIIILGIYGVVIWGLSYLPQAGPLRLGGDEASAWLLFNLYTPEILVFFVPILIFIRWKRLGFKETLRLRTISLGTVLGAIVIGVGFVIVLAGINSLLSPLFQRYHESVQHTIRQLTRAAGVNIYLFFIGVTLVPAVCEEMLFRGFILSGLEAEHGQTRAVLLSALLFGILHFIPSQIVLMTLFGILLGVVTIKTRSIFPAILIHIINNLLAALLILYPDLLG